MQKTLSIEQLIETAKDLTAKLDPSGNFYCGFDGETQQWEAYSNLEQADDFERFSWMEDKLRDALENLIDELWEALNEKSQEKKRPV